MWERERRGACEGGREKERESMWKKGGEGEKEFV